MIKKEIDYHTIPVQNTRYSKIIENILFRQLPKSQFDINVM